MDYDNLDSRYEFDAPQFFDFNQPEAYEEAFNDTWFDRRKFLIAFVMIVLK